VIQRDDVFIWFQSTLPAKGATLKAEGQQELLKVSIHAPREGSDWRCNATHNGRDPRFNPRSPRRERLARNAGDVWFQWFQSTLPAKGATGTCHRLFVDYKFQSTLPAKGATTNPIAQQAMLFVSIHAPREGSDIGLAEYMTPYRSFNPRSPRRERHWAGGIYDTLQEFQSTLPAKGATVVPEEARVVYIGFNPRSPRRERHRVCVYPQ